MYGVKFNIGYNNNEPCTDPLVSSANQYLRSSLKVRLYEAILLLFYVREVPILLLLRKKGIGIVLYCIKNGIVKAIKSGFSIHDLQSSFAEDGLHCK